MTTTEQDRAVLMESHGYIWPDLRERRFGALEVGRVVFKPDAFSAYRSGGPDCEVAGMSFVLLGTAWTITERDGDLVTLVRHDGEARQTVRIHPDYVVLAVENPEGC